MPFNEQEAGEKMIMCYKCREWFHDTCLVNTGTCRPGLFRVLISRGPDAKTRACFQTPMYSICVLTHARTYV